MGTQYSSIMEGDEFFKGMGFAAIVELTFYRVNKWFVKKTEITRQKLDSNNTYTPYIERKI